MRQVSSHIQDPRVVLSPTTATLHQLWYRRGKSLVERGEYEVALASFDSALKIHPDDYRSWVFRGVALAHLRYYESALHTFTHATQLAPTQHEAWTFRGAVLKALKRPQEAMSSYGVALKCQHAGSKSCECFPMWLPE